MGSGKDKSRSSTETSRAGTGGVEAQLLSFLTSALDEGEQRHAPVALSPGKREGTRPIGG